MPRSNADGPAQGPTGAELDKAPSGLGTENEQEYDYDLYVHCGIDWARVDGAPWRTAPRSGGNANPP